MAITLTTLLQTLLSSLSSTSLLFISLLLSFLALHHLISHSKPSPHGPIHHPLIGCLLAFYRNRGRLLDWYTEMLAASPSQTIVLQRLGAWRTVVTANPDNVEHILKTNFNNYPKGRPFRDLLGDLLGVGIFVTDGELWQAQRKLASHEFSTNSLRDFTVSVLETETEQRLVPLLAKAGREGRVVDLQEIFRRFSFDTICRLSLGTDPGYLDESMPRVGIADAFDIASTISAGRGMAPLQLVWKVKRALRVGSEAELRDAIGVIHSYVSELIAARERDCKDVGGRSDLLSRLIDGGHSGEVVRDMVISFMMAGRDTTSAVLTWFFWVLSSRPDVEMEVAKEVLPTNKQLTYNQLMKMKVLEACLCETMRLFPPGAWDSKFAAGYDVLPDGTKVGRGDRVTYFPYGMGRMESLWGERCREFDHWRWLSNDGEVAKVSPYKFTVFQAGPRVCLGKDMAFVQMKYVAASVVRRFRMRPPEGAGGAQPTYVPLLTAHMAGGLGVMVEEREGSDAHG